MVCYISNAFFPEKFSGYVKRDAEIGSFRLYLRLFPPAAAEKDETPQAHAGFSHR